jgi:hypothetical protein
MTKLVCIDNIPYNNYRYNNYKNNIGLTLNKVYDCYYEDFENVFIFDDNGEKSMFYRKRFITLADWRDQQIDKILE